jgi:hypothetical protein
MPAPSYLVHVYLVLDGLVKDKATTAVVMIKASLRTVTVFTGIQAEHTTPSLTGVNWIGLYIGQMENLALFKSKQWHGTQKIGYNRNLVLANVTCPGKCKTTDCDLTTAIHLFWWQFQ